MKNQDKLAKTLPISTHVESHQPAKSTLHVLTHHKSYDINYAPGQTFYSDELRLSTDGWVWQGLEEVVAASKVAPESYQKVALIKRVLMLLCEAGRDVSLLNFEPASLGRREARQVFQATDDLAQAGSCSARASARFRSFAYDTFLLLPTREHIDRQTLVFRPKSRDTANSRGLISDFHDIGNELAKLPVGATLISSARELKAKIADRIDSDLQRIRAACIADMDTAEMLRAQLMRACAEEVDEPELEIYKRALYSSESREYLKRTRLPVESQLRALAVWMDRHELARAEQKYSVGFGPKLLELLYMRAESDAVRFSSRRIFELPYRCCAEEIFAAFHLLQSHTGWNIASIITLEVSNIELSADFVTIQGFKGKTDDDTPIAQIEFTNAGVERAVKLLLWNRLQLIKLGYFGAYEKRLWVVARARSDSNKFHPIHRLNDFTNRHSLPNYSIEQLRNQVLHAESSRNGIEAARRKAGHSELATTDGYISRIVQERLDSSMNISYSTQLAREVTYIFKGERTLNQLALLRPIGDGASCTTPDQPPMGRNFGPGPCNAENCHSKGGCPSRRIAIDSSRIEEVIRTRMYFMDSWKQKWLENGVKYAEQVAPAIAFNEALHQILVTGPYAAQVEKIRRQIALSDQGNQADQSEHSNG